MGKKRKTKEVEEMDLSGATVTEIDENNQFKTLEVPKEIIKNKEANAWRFDYAFDKTCGATFSIGEFCAPIVTMPEGWVDESKMVNEYDSFTNHPDYEARMQALLVYKGIVKP